jgi:hypothetical protein
MIDRLCWPGTWLQLFPSTVANTISARHTALLELLRSAMIASSRARFAGLTFMLMLSRLMAAHRLICDHMRIICQVTEH